MKIVLSVLSAIGAGHLYGLLPEVCQGTLSLGGSLAITYALIASFGASALCWHKL